jgi:pimeloyl-ACP methyl ester carboxylesterase
VTTPGRRGSGEGAHRLRRALKLVSPIAIFAVLVGATYQGVSTAIERREYPPPGVMVDVGGHQLHLFCSGSGSPTVVFESPALGTSGAWAWVTPLVAARTRVCVYDRAGLGWSESGDRGFDPLRVADELHTLLPGAQESGPYVLVGQGLGAAFARLYAARFHPELRGLVLVDAPDAGTGRDERTTRLVRMSPWLARAGILRATRLLSSEARTLPHRSGEAQRAFLNRPNHLTRGGRELERWTDIVEIAARAPLPPIPVRSIAVAGPAPLALITSEEQARQVAAAVQDLIALQ